MKRANYDALNIRSKRARKQITISSYHITPCQQVTSCQQVTDHDNWLPTASYFGTSVEKRRVIVAVLQHLDTEVSHSARHHSHLYKRGLRRVYTTPLITGVL
jgi:hypothetical protein